MVVHDSGQGPPFGALRARDWLAQQTLSSTPPSRMNDPLMLALGELIRKEISAGQLLQRVVEVMAGRLKADRATIFLLNHSGSELVSIAGLLSELEEIRVPVDQGVAGYVARTERVVNIPFCESDARFWRRIDEQTGYTTQSMLAGPLYDTEQHLIGVVQFLNKDSGVFDEGDEAIFAQLSRQVAGLLAETTFEPRRKSGSPYQDLSGPSPPLLDSFNRVVGHGPVMQKVFQQVRRAAPADATVLMRGESGTGKSLIARALHHNSRRAAGPFVHVDCTTLPDGLIENELFGHERGAYTGAGQRQTGKVELASGGTLFLDEIGDLPLSLQGKLLRVMQDRTYTRLGGTEMLQADIRIVTATNRDLESLVEKGRFREDLYYRLRVIVIDLPPLRERGPDDLVKLIKHFVAVASKRHRKPLQHVRHDALNALLTYRWPGNVRELENCIESAVIFSDGEITPSKLSLPRRHATMELQAINIAQLAQAHATALNPFERGPTLRDLEAEYIAYLLTRHENNRSACARILGIGRNTLLRKIKEYDLE